MKDFALIFRHSETAKEVPTPEELAERLAWLDSLAREGRLVDAGRSLSVGNARTVKSASLITDGPYAEIKEFISGFMVLKAEAMEEAMRIALANPIFKAGGFVEIREVVRPEGNPQGA